MNDHLPAQTDLHTITNGQNIYAHDSTDSAHVALAMLLMTLDGRVFDSVYIHSQVPDHQNSITLFRNEATNGTYTALRNHASAKLPKLQCTNIWLTV